MEVKLFHSNPRGLAEPIRLLLNDQQINYKEYRIPSDEWTQIEPKLVFGEVPFARPFLLWGDEEICFARHIHSFLGERIPCLKGKNAEQASCMVHFNEQMFNFLEKYEPIINGKSKEEKEDYIKNELSEKLSWIERRFCIFRSHVPDEQKSYPDYVFFEILDLHLNLTPNALDHTPVLKMFYQRFSELPNIKSYLEKSSALNL